MEILIVIILDPFFQGLNECHWALRLVNPHQFLLHRPHQPFCMRIALRIIIDESAPRLVISRRLKRIAG